MPVVLYLHGIQSHPGWFTGSGAHLARAGYRVLSITRRGSGEIRWGRGDAPGAARLLDDLDDALRYARGFCRASRVHVVGVSWGGKLAAAWLACRSPSLASATLVAPGLAAQVDVSASTKAAIAASLACCPRRQFEIPLSEPELFTDNPAVLAYLREDPVRLKKATARFLFVSRCMDGQIARLRRGSIEVPTTLLLASRERIIDSERTREIVGHLSADRARVVELEGCHTLEFEPDPSAFYDELLSSLVPEPTSPAE
ncbi:MAG: alpha/beta fold hydrolase [Phycisphaerae bacterium]